MSRKRPYDPQPIGNINNANRSADVLGERIRAAEEAAEKAREATRGLREALAEAGDHQRAFKAAETKLKRLADDEVSCILEAEVTRQVGILGEQTEIQMRKSVAKVSSEFDRLEKSFLGKERDDGRMSIDELIEQMNEITSVRWPLLVKAVLAAKEMEKGCSDVDCDSPADFSVLLKVKPGQASDRPENPQGRLGHVHLCRIHTAEIEKAGMVQRKVDIQKEMCPYPHGPGVELVFKDDFGWVLYGSRTYTDEKKMQT
jgi:hypothetical protein